MMNVTLREPKPELADWLIALIGDDWREMGEYYRLKSGGELAAETNDYIKNLPDDWWYAHAHEPEDWGLDDDDLAEARTDYADLLN